MTFPDAYIIGPLLSQFDSDLLVAESPDLPLVVAVDEGIDRSMELELVPDIAVGDFDSVSAAGLSWIEEYGDTIKVFQAEREKDFSDLDLALRICRDKGIARAMLFGFIGGKLDHQLAVLGVCARYAPDFAITLNDADETIVLITSGLSTEIEAGREFSVMALESVASVSIMNAFYPLDHHSLKPLSDLGLSNIALKDCVVTVHEGVAAII
ncbi:MAG: thiamine diphosphokinase [Coriobacteriia bacterium]|nr:thiamine diphosphokinase [Coriobacteriia bacterium]